MARLLLFLLLPATLRGATPNELIDAGHYLRVKALMNPIVQAHPEDAESLYFLSRAEGALGNLDLSLKLAEKAVALNDANAIYHVQLAAACGRLAQAASMVKQLGYARRAKKELDVSLELDPKNEDALYGLALFYYAAPSLLGGDKAKAQAAADALTELDQSRGYLTDAKLANERKDVAAEEDFYKKAIAAKPEYYDSHAALAKFYSLHGRMSEANREASAAINLDPGRADGWKVLAQVQVVAQCWDELLEVLRAARAAVPDDLSYYYSAALALEDAQRFIPWANNFVTIYTSAPAEGNEPTLTEAAKTANASRGCCKLRYFLKPHRAPPLRRILLVESGSRHLIERLIPNLRAVFGTHLRFDICTCFPGRPTALESGSSAVYRTSDYQTGAARKALYEHLAGNGYDAIGIICSAEPIMTKWKWMLAHRVPAKLFLLNENADYVWFDAKHTEVLFAYARTRMGFEGTGAVRTLARIVLLPFTLVYLLAYALTVHTRRALRLLAS